MPETPELSIPTEKVCAIIQMTRQFDAKDAVTEPNPDSNATDDGMREVLEDHADDPVHLELVTFIDDLDVDEQVDLVTLARLGRGDASLDEWDALRAETADVHDTRAAIALTQIPLLSDYLEEALSLLGESCADLGAERL